ncbi:MAG: NrfD/PsrC family molybdoenzyme membrane anchor subunit [Candidatus Korobacteraceae bacterium]|jgi:formate-dependent nitrite reductase membrane component NrfD
MAKISQQTARQWIVTHEWMVNPMQQTEWIEGRGVLIWLAEVFSSLGTGLYLVSIFVNNWRGALVGWLIVIGLKLPLHIIYLGKPSRFWRAMPPFTNAWRTSWIARGSFFTAVFSLVGLLQLISSYVSPGSGIDILLKVVAGFFCILTALYCGFMMSYCKSLPFWNTGLLPIVIMNAGIADGLALLIGLGMIAGGVNFAAVETVTRVLLLFDVLLIATLVMNGSYRSATAGFSSKELTTGRTALAFWVGTVLMGIIVPLAISLQTLWSTGETTHGLMIAAVVAHTIGAFALKYCILKVGIYEPILPKAKVLGRAL